jgi:hypothetical protein
MSEDEKLLNKSIFSLWHDDLLINLWPPQCFAMGRKVPEFPHPRTRRIITINKIRIRSLIANLVHPGVQATFYISFPHAPC